MASPAGAWRSKSAALRSTGTGPAPTPAAPAGSKRPAAKPAIEDPAAGSKQAVDERMLFVASVLIGCTVQVQVKSGVTYEGIFHALRPAGSDFDVLLRMAKPLAPASTSAAAAGEDWKPVRPTPVLAIEAAELVQITASDVRIGASDVGAAGSSAWDDAGGFGTDAAISRSRGTWGRERELQRWAPAEGEESQMLQLEDSMGGGGRGWDQFAVNEAKFGVRTNYAEEFYTTELDPSKSKISVAEASRIASEIERGDRSMANTHMLEERGVAIDDSQMDEEDRYGAVVREAPPARGANGSAAAAPTAAVGSATQPRPNAWAAGRPRPLLPGAAPSAPISIDPRREANKLRMQMTTSGVKQTSPYGTPNALKRPSPMSSPLISDPSKLEALNLNPGVPRVDEQTRREFEKFKAQQAASKGGSSSDNIFKKQDLEGYKQFSQSIEGKLSRSLGKDSSMPLQPPSAAAAAAAAASASAAGVAAAAAAAAAGAAGAAAKAAAAEAAPAAAAALAVGGGGAEQPAAAAAASGEGAKKPGLNPNAKSFNFNPNAKSFVFAPGGGAAPASEAAPAGGGPAAAHAPTPAAPTMSHGSPHGGGGHSHMGPSGPHGGGYRQGPPSPMRGPMPMPQHPAPGIPMPDMRPDFRRMPRGDDGGVGPGSHPPRPERDSSFGRRREESRERGGPGGFDRRRDGGRHYDGGPGMRGGDGGPPPPPPGKGPGGPGMQMMPMGPGMVPMGPGMQMMPMMPGHGQHMFMVRPMGPGQPTMVPMGPGMVPMGGPGMMGGPYGAPYAMHGGMAGSSPGGRPMMMPQMMMMGPGGMVAHGMYGGPHGGGPHGGGGHGGGGHSGGHGGGGHDGGGHGGGGRGGKPDDRGE